MFYTALELKEIGAVPGGTPRTFWLPVYITSISSLSAYIKSDKNN